MSSPTTSGPRSCRCSTAAADADKIDVCETEARVFGVTHADVGGLVAQQWRLPQSIVDAITQHHSVRDDLPPICAAVSLAHTISQDLCMDDHPPIEQVEAQHLRVVERRPIMRQLGIDPETYPEVVDTARKKFGEVVNRFDF